MSSGLHLPLDGRDVYTRPMPAKHGVRRFWTAALLGPVAGLLLFACGSTTPHEEETSTQAQSMAPTTVETPTSPPTTANPDLPTRTQSGRVFPSRDPRLPPAYGPNPAKVNVVVFSDFQCPVCRRITDATHQIAEEWPGDVRVEFRQLALDMHGNARNAAVASLAAQRQGKFWEMHDLLFEHQDALDESSLAAYAEQAGCDPAQYAKDYADPALRQRIADEVALAGRLGARATPAFLINGKLGVGWGSWSAFRSQVEQELNAVNALLAKGTKLRDVHARRARENAANAAAFEAYKAGIIDPLARAAG
jgi:protein-disulfide isomerase